MQKQGLLEKVFNDPQPLPRKVPDYMRKKGGLWYWTGSMVMTAFFYEVITGVILFIYYQPSNAYASTENILTIPYGSVILTTHLYGAYVMIALVYIHLLRNLFVGAYKQPREMQWVTGVLLLILTVTVSYFGYSLSGDILSADATDVSRGIANGFPVIGSYISAILLGNGHAISLFTRFEDWHIILAGSILVLFAVHFFLAEYNTIMPHPKLANYAIPAIDKEDPSYKPWYPYNLYYMAQVTLYTVALIFILPSIIALLPHIPALFSPFPQVSASNPLASSVPPYPPWFLLFVYKELDFGISASIGPFWAVVLFTGLPLVYLFLIPYIEKSRTLKTTRRQLLVSTGIVGIVYLLGLSTWGALTPGIPVSNVVGLMFFAIPLVVVIPLVYFVSGLMESGKTKINDIWKAYALFAVTAFLSILSGISLYGWVLHPNLYYSISTIIALLILGLSALSTYAAIFGIRKNTFTKPLSSRSYLVFGGAYGFLAILILSIISVIPPTTLLNQSLYGLGLGLIFLIGGVYVKLYRSRIYNE